MSINKKELYIFYIDWVWVGIEYHSVKTLYAKISPNPSPYPIYIFIPDSLGSKPHKYPKSVGKIILFLLSSRSLPKTKTKDFDPSSPSSYFFYCYSPKEIYNSNAKLAFNIATFFLFQFYVSRGTRGANQNPRVPEFELVLLGHPKGTLFTLTHRQTHSLIFVHSFFNSINGGRELKRPRSALHF